ncbi:MAG: LruC domain-containing protein [Pseudomonadota bacterium]
MKPAHTHTRPHYRSIATRLVLCVAGALSLLIGQQVSANAFDDCPSDAFLIQHTNARLFGVNLATGYYRELEDDLGTNDKINALGFNFHDNFLYGWGYEHRGPVKIGADYQISVLPAEGLPDTNFYVGDVAINENTYYVYRSGSAYGLYAIDLDVADGEPLTARRIIDGSALKLTIFDIAFHPDNGFAYAVDRSGNLHEIDVSVGSSQRIGNVGVSGTFGAAYFDVDGYLYVSRNSDGYIFRINLQDASPSAQFYAHGPASNNNDGARCALAPIVSDTDSDIDFGDAPDSYGTLLENNGARHNISDNTVFLGAQVDGESDAYVAPLADDEADGVDDEDGVQFVTGFELGTQSIVIANASTAAYLNGWIDWNRNGTFDTDERVISQQIVTGGDNYVMITTPIWAETGPTWARFRLSSTANIGPTGGVSDGEVEDYPITVVANGVTESTYPSANTWSTIAFEDNWPLQGDYDMNDLVAHLRFRELVREEKVVGIEVSGEIVAVGGVYHNGFAIRLPGVNATSLPQNAIEFWIDDQPQSQSPLESEQGEVILVVTNDVWDHVSPGEGCTFHRTEIGCESQIQMTFKVRVSFGLGVDSSVFPAVPYDPFMYATPGYGRVGFDTPPGRGLEIHLPGQSPTDLFDMSLLGQGDDRSNPSDDLYFRTETGMPWALEIASEWKYPLEFEDITDAYPLFESFVISAGEENATWYLPENADLSLIYYPE